MAANAAQRWENLQNESSQEALDIKEFVARLMEITAQNSSESASADINPIQYLLDKGKRKEWRDFLQEKRLRLYKAVVSGSTSQNDQPRKDFRKICDLFKIESDESRNILALWISLKSSFKLGSSKLTPDIIVELMDRYKELDVFVRDCEALESAHAHYERPSIPKDEENRGNRSGCKCCAETFCAGAGFFIIYTVWMIIGAGVCVIATMVTPPDTPDNPYVPVANFFAGILSIYIGIANVMNRSFRKHWIIMLMISVILVAFFLAWIVAMGIWHSHPRGSKGIVLITPFIITIPFAAFTYMSAHPDKSGDSPSPKRRRRGSHEEMLPLNPAYRR